MAILNYLFYSEIEVIEELVEKNGLNVLNARDEWGYTPTHWAALDGNIEVSFEYDLLFLIIL
jgi:ankyrin repeat protein